MRTWRWLKVNDAYQPEGTGTPEVQQLQVAAGSKETKVLLLDGITASSFKASVAAGGELDLAVIHIGDKPLANEVVIEAAAGAKINYTGIELSQGDLASKVTLELAGDESAADMAVFYLADGSRTVDMNYLIRQGGRRTDADMQVRGAMLDESTKTFRGTLDFLRGSKGSVGRENEEVITLSPHIHNRSVPLMLAGEDDVDGHHAVSIGKLDEMKLFYLQSRGLDLAASRRLIVEAALLPILDRLQAADLREKLHEIMKGRLADENR